MSQNFNADQYVVRPPEAVWVERRHDQLVIRWAGNEPPVAVHAGLTPEHINRHNSLGPVDAAAGYILLDQPVEAPRRYFELEFPDGRRYVTSERVLPLPDGVNFRDIGGYQTRDGRTTRWGLVYRSGSLAELTASGLAYLSHLGLTLSCDLRTPEEVEQHPDRVPSGARVLSLPVAGTVNPIRRVVTLLRKRHRARELLEEVYKIMLDQNGHLFGHVFHAAARPDNLPLVVHCTAGKDRTGLIVAMLLSVLGVDDETIIADYTLTNYDYDVLAGRMRPEMERLYAFGFGESQMRSLLLAEAQTMANTLAYIRQRYGSLDWYLLKAGVTEDVIAQVRANLLTEPQSG